MSKVIDSPRGKWRYTPGHWVRAADGSMVSKCQFGRRAGAWKAIPLHGGKPIQLPAVAGLSTWRGWATAAEARAAVDSYLDEADARIRATLTSIRGEG